MAILTEPPPEAANHWADYPFSGHDWSCVRVEYCHRCGRELVEHYELTGDRSRKTGQPQYARYHSCPTWFEGWRASRWARGWACPGWGHDSHDADNPLLSRGYR